MQLDRDEGQLVGPRQLVRRLGGARDPSFSLCVMVTDWGEFEECLGSFKSRGFDEGCTEYLVLDNSGGNKADAYVALNEFLQCAAGPHIILSHQDILLLDDGRTKLEAVLAELDRDHPHWGVCGNAGHTDDGWPVLCLSHPYRDRHVVGGPFPAEVVSLDENFLVVRKAANLALSRDLGGFHHYGGDLCVIADVLGWRAFVVEFYVRHKSRGTVDERYFLSEQALAGKYQRAFRSRWLHLITRRPVFLAGSPLLHRASRLRYRVGKLIGVNVRDRDLDDPAKRARRDKRRGRLAGTR